MAFLKKNFFYAICLKIQHIHWLNIMNNHNTMEDVATWEDITGYRLPVFLGMQLSVTSLL